jgi:hypothetical protein
VGDDVGVIVVGDDVGVTVVGGTLGSLVGTDVGFVVGLVVDGTFVGDAVMGDWIVYVISPPKYRGNIYSPN